MTAKDDKILEVVYELIEELRDKGILSLWTTEHLLKTLRPLERNESKTPSQKSNSKKGTQANNKKEHKNSIHDRF